MLYILRPESVSHSPRPVLVAFVQNHVFSSSQGGSKVITGNTKSSQEFFQASDPQARLRGRHSFHPELVSTTGLELTLFEGFTGQTQGCLDSVKGDKTPAASHLSSHKAFRCLLSSLLCCLHKNDLSPGFSSTVSLSRRLPSHFFLSKHITVHRPEGLSFPLAGRKCSISWALKACFLLGA